MGFIDSASAIKNKNWEGNFMTKRQSYKNYLKNLTYEDYLDLLEDQARTNYELAYEAYLGVLTYEDYLDMLLDQYLTDFEKTFNNLFDALEEIVSLSLLSLQVCGPCLGCPCRLVCFGNPKSYYPLIIF